MHCWPLNDGCNSASYLVIDIQYIVYCCDRWVKIYIQKRIKASENLRIEWGELYQIRGISSLGVSQPRSVRSVRRPHRPPRPIGEGESQQCETDWRVSVKNQINGGSLVLDLRDANWWWTEKETHEETTIRPTSKWTNFVLKKPAIHCPFSNRGRGSWISRQRSTLSSIYVVVDTCNILYRIHI